MRSAGRYRPCDVAGHEAPGCSRACPQINHPHSDVGFVPTTEWAVRNSLKVLMAAPLLCGPVTDQAELHGLIAKVRDLGIALVSVTTIDAPGHGHVE